VEGSADGGAVLFLSIAYLVLAVFGQAYGPYQPDFSVCFLQAALIYAALPLCVAQSSFVRT
jgi:hypothetical protein